MSHFILKMIILYMYLQYRYTLFRILSIKLNLRDIVAEPMEKQSLLWIVFLYYKWHNWLLVKFIKYKNTLKQDNGDYRDTWTDTHN